MTGEEIDLIIRYRKLDPIWKVHILTCMQAAVAAYELEERQEEAQRRREGRPS